MEETLTIPETAEESQEFTGAETETTNETETPEEEETNLYGNPEDNDGSISDNTKEPEYVDFSNDELSPFRDTFLNSKISVEDYGKFEEKIKELSSPKEFSKEMINTYGENAPEVLRNYQQLTNDIFTPEEKDLLNKLPSCYKTLMVKMGKSLGERYDKLKEDYGITTEETTAIPEHNQQNLEERFSKLTEQLLNGKLSAEEYQRIKQERLEIANYM